MDRKALIKAQAQEHKARGIYDNAICRNGMERVFYAETWAA